MVEILIILLLCSIALIVCYIPEEDYTEIYDKKHGWSYRIHNRTGRLEVNMEWLIEQDFYKDLIRRSK